MAPTRIQLRRTKGWKKPPGCVVVARPTVFGNPFIAAAAREVGYGEYNLDGSRATEEESDRRLGEWCVRLYRLMLSPTKPSDATDLQPRHKAQRDKILARLPGLRGRDLACWCPLGSPCHADVLLDLANRPEDAG